jgi:hypothetical protein
MPRGKKQLRRSGHLAAVGREVGRSDTVPGHPKGGECLVLCNSIIRNVGTKYSDMKAECFPGIRTEQLQRVIERRELGGPDSVVIHVGTNDLIRTVNLDYVMGDVYGLVNTAKTKFSTTRVVLSGVLRREDVSWRRIGAVNDRLEWVANTLGVTFVDTNSWVDNWDFSRDGLHLNRRGARHLGQLYSRVCGISGGRQMMRGD